MADENNKSSSDDEISKKKLEDLDSQDYPTKPDLGEQDEFIVKEVNQRYAHHAYEKREMEKIWHINTSFFLGKQWKLWDDKARVLREDNKVPRYRVRLTANKIFPTIKTKIAQMLKARPTFTVLPNSSEDEDAMAAKIGDKVLKHLWRKLDLDVSVHELATWIFTCGAGFVKYYWDAQTGKVVGFNDDQTPIYEGELCVEVVSPFEMIVDCEAKNMQDLLWAQQTRPRTLDWIRTQFPETGEYVRSEKEQQDDFKRKLKKTSALSQHISGSTEDAPKEPYAIVKEYWHKPGAKYPKGLHAIVADNVVLYKEPLVKEKGDLPELPLIMFSENIMPGRFWPVSTTEQLISLQKEYNKTISQIVEIKNLVAKPKVLNPKGSGVAKSSFTTEPGEIIEHRAGLAPGYMQLPQMPVFVSENLARISQDIDEISGVNEVSKGMRPEGTRSALQLQFLAEQDASKIATTIHLFEKSLGQLGTRMLSVIQGKYKESRQLKIVGKNSEHELMGFKGSDLKGNFDVHVQTMSALETSKAALRAQLLELVQYGFVTPENTHPSKLLSMMELGNMQAFYDINTRHESISKRENMVIAKGGLAKAEEWEDHNIHVSVHNEFRNTLEYQKLPEVTRKYMDAHIKQHLDFLEDQQMAQDLDQTQMEQMSSQEKPQLADILGQKQGG